MSFSIAMPTAFLDPGMENTIVVQGDAGWLTLQLTDIDGKWYITNTW